MTSKEETVATIHMETDSIRKLERAIQTEHSNILSSISGLRSQSTSLIGSSWQGQSASEFGKQLEDLLSQQIILLDQMHELRVVLVREIIQWEVMRARLA